MDNNITHFGTYHLLSDGLFLSMVDTNKLIAVNVKRIREKLGLSQEAFGKPLDQKHTVISDIERNIRPVGKAWIERACKEFNIKQMEFYYEEPVNKAIPIDLMKDEIDKIYRTIDNTQREKLLEFARDRKILSNSKEGLYRDDTPAGKERGQRRKKN
jgi:transcriptional regulator with XRE-family HTH domain